jgi:Glycosyl transferase family 41
MQVHERAKMLGALRAEGCRCRPATAHSLHLRGACNYGRSAIRRPRLGSTSPRGPSDKIRIAYLSSDFRHHPVAYLLPALIERHDRTRFEVAAISFGPDDGSDIRARLVQAFDRFEDLTVKSDHEIALWLRELQIDIAVDLTGYTQYARPSVLSCRPAPINVSFLGYPGSTGANFIDYILADKVVLPFDHQPYTRRGSFTCRTASFPGTVRGRARHRLLLPARKKGCRQRGLSSAASTTAASSQRPCSWHGCGYLLPLREACSGFRPRTVQPWPICAMRLRWLEWIRRESSLRRIAGRVAASMLHAVGLPELVTYSLDEYEALARKLAVEPLRLQSIRRTLDDNRKSFPLFNLDRYRRNLETAYTMMWERWRRGKRPESFSVPPCDDGGGR